MVELQKNIAEYNEKIELFLSTAEWQDLSIVLNQRQAMLEVFFSELTVNEKTSEVRQMIRKIQAENAAFLRNLQAQKKALEKHILAFKQGRQSVKAYHNL